MLLTDPVTDAALPSHLELCVCRTAHHEVPLKDVVLQTTVSSSVPAASIALLLRQAGLSVIATGAMPLMPCRGSEHKMY